MISIRKWRRGWMIWTTVIALISVVTVLSGCQLSAAARNDQGQAASTSAEAETQQETTASHAQEGHLSTSSEGHRAELDGESPIELDPSKGQEIGSVFEAFLSPHQQGGEEEDTPDIIPDIFKSTAPSVSRNERQSRGHGVLSFTNDLSKAYVHVAIEEVNPEEIVMFHIHCGRPGQLGPIIINFALAGDLQEYWADNMLTLELTNEDIEAVVNHGEGIVAAFTDGCPILAAIPIDKVKTIAGMEFIARQGELYFNLHTKGQTYFGDIRGQLHRVNP